MQDTSPRTGADCLQEERASVFQLKELFFPPPLFFFPSSPRLWMCYSQVRSTKHPQWQLSPFTVLLAAQPADRSRLSWDQEGLVQVSATAFHQNPSAPFTDSPWSHHKQTYQPPPRQKKRKNKNNTNNKNVNTRAHSNKRVQEKKKSETSQKGEKSSCLQYKTF